MLEGFNQLADGAQEAVQKIPEKKTTSVDLDSDRFMKEINDSIRALNVVPDQKTVKAEVKTDPVQLATVKKTIIETLPDGTTTIHDVYVDEPKLNVAKNALNSIPGEKSVSVKPTIDGTVMKKEAKEVEKALEWKAKVDIAQAEQATKQLQMAFTSVDAGIKGTGDMITGLFDKLKDASGSSYWKIMDQIDTENKRRSEQFELQKKLLEQQVKLMEARAKAMEGGNNQINIKADGLKPHLEMILWEILEAIQVRATAESSEFLLGL
jgi:hypothetical protein